MKNTLSMSGRLRQRMVRALLVLGVAIGALASTAAPAHAATVVIGCFQRPNIDPAMWTVRVDLRVWNSVERAWKSTGQSVWINISRAGSTCQLMYVPPQYQNFYTTLIVDHTYTQNGTILQWYGWSGQYAPPGANLVYTLPGPPVVTWLRSVSSSNYLNLQYASWH